jgi:starch synthase
MPSRFEPCGLAQQYAMRYGSLPIARRTGGLADTVKHFSRSLQSANGFLFNRANAEDLKKVINRAIKLFDNQSQFAKIQLNALSTRCSWEFAAKQYSDIYQWTTPEA